ncbi:hypothetical protein C6P45_004804 [Maudiozyma exigua]|uniref:Uncharacterized protein n=1 Tax=Maudiozyma exigua TaxID=34358 RepID=A0A9P6WBH2_MAUEX|nr:hypothetical protein C6P45_004804 [Kazachstania exigua]
MAHCLKRTLSSSTLNNISTKRNTVTSLKSLHRTYSQASICTTPITISQNLKDDSFQEFYSYLNGDQYYEKAGSLWEHLPQETRDIFVARVMDKRYHATRGNTDSFEILDGLNYNDACELFNGKKPTKNSYMHFYGKMSPHFYNSGNTKYDAATVSKIIGRIYNQELTESDRERLKKETMDLYKKEVRDRLFTAKQYIEKNKERCDNDPLMATIDKWNHEKLGNRLDEINNLIRTIEVKQEKFVEKEKKQKKKKTLINTLGKQSKKFIKVLSKKSN